MTEKVGSVELRELWLEGEMERSIETEGAGPWGDICPRVVRGKICGFLEGDSYGEDAYMLWDYEVLEMTSKQ